MKGGEIVRNVYNEKGLNPTWAGEAAKRFVASVQQCPTFQLQSHSTDLSFVQSPIKQNTQTFSSTQLE